MLANKLLALAMALRTQPHLIDSIADNLDDLADCVRALERSAIAPALIQAGVFPLPANVVRLDRGARA